MTLQEFIDNVHFGDLYGHGIFSDALNQGSIDRLTYFVNMGILDIHMNYYKTREYIYLHTNPSRFTYHIVGSNATSDLQDIDDTRYIYVPSGTADIDTRLIQLIKIFDPETESYINYNDINTIKGIQILNHNTLQFDSTLLGTTYTLEYLTRSPIVSLLTDTIQLPVQYMQPLSSFVAYKIYSSGTSQEHIVAATSHYQRYVTLCEDMQVHGVGSPAYSLT